MLYNVSTYLTFHQITNIFLTPYNVTRPSTLHHTSHTPTRQKLGPLCQLSLTIVGRGVCAKNFRNQSETDDHMSRNNQSKSFNCQFRAISITSSLVLRYLITIAEFVVKLFQTSWNEMSTCQVTPKLN